VPETIYALFQSTVTPNPDVVFSPIEFTTAGSEYPAVDPSTVFQNPVGHVYGIFTYDGMVPGAQWTALWFRDGELVGYETKPWDGATGGSGYTDWGAPPSEWTPAIYTVQIFVGEMFAVSGRFLVQGDAPTAVSSQGLTPTATTTLAALATGTPGSLRAPSATGTGAP
jgi:hypothetical protein